MIALDVQEIFHPLAIAKRGRIHDHEIIKIGWEFFEILFYIGLDKLVRAGGETVQCEIFFRPIEIGLGQIDGMHAGSAACGGIDGKGTGITKQVKHLFALRLLLTMALVMR